MNKIIGELPHLVDSFIGNILSYAVVLATVATITMTFLELFKSILKLRLKFHRKRVELWIKDDLLLEELLILTVSEIDSASALYDQSSDKMLGQIQSATIVAIDFPDMYPHFFEFITRSPKSKAAAEETGGSGYRSSNEQPTDAEIWAEFITHDNRTKSINSIEDDAYIQRATKARARIDHFIARKLDAFQTQLEYDWARKNQYLSVLACACLLMGLLLYLCVPILPAVGLSFFGGMMAPLAKDIVSALSGLRSK